LKLSFKILDVHTGVGIDALIERSVESSCFGLVATRGHELSYDSQRLRSDVDFHNLSIQITMQRARIFDAKPRWPHERGRWFSNREQLQRSFCIAKPMAMHYQHARDKRVRLRQRDCQRHDSADGTIEPAARGGGERFTHACACFSQAKLKGFEGNGDGNEGRIGLIV